MCDEYNIKTGVDLANNFLWFTGSMGDLVFVFDGVQQIIKNERIEVTRQYGEYWGGFVQRALQVALEDEA